MKIFRFIAVVSVVALGAVVITHGGAGPSTNQNQTAGATHAPPAPGGPLREPVKSVLDHYFKIQAALAEDSTNGISTNAVAISSAVKQDKNKMLPLDVADQADGLAKAADLAGAREAFKDLSQSLINYMADKNVETGRYDEIFCPMAGAYWLQTNRDIVNPYVGNSMPGCGEKKRNF